MHLAGPLLFGRVGSPAPRIGLEWGRTCEALQGVGRSPGIGDGMTTLFVAESGDPAGEPLLLLPGGGFSGAMWQPQVEALQEYHCCVMDLPGHGRSDGDFSLAAAAEGVAQVIGSSFGGRPALVVGLSIGGAVGLELLCRRPELVKAASCYPCVGCHPVVGRSGVSERCAQAGSVVGGFALSLCPSAESGRAGAGQDQCHRL